MARELTIGAHTISDAHPCYVVAEIGNNHSGDRDTALAMIRKAAECGASAIKLQCRDNLSLYSPAILNKPYENEHSYGKTYGEHRLVVELTRDGLAECWTEAEVMDVDAFATAFDEVSADRLMAMGAPAIKLASGALTDTALQKHVAELHVPILFSTGGGTEQDIDRAVQTISAYHTRFAILHATASYPLDPKEANLRCILTLRNRYPDTVIGYSSHSTGLVIPMIAYAFGANLIEVHFTLDRSSKGTDHAFSLEPKGLQTLVEDLAKIRVALGDGVKRWYDSEKGPIAKMRRVRTERGLQITGELDE